ncbi:NAD(P)H-quinone oxidoreductase subunit K [Striga asiatica]|uniref:NAD(P)H-quinone oxidoreductase subunit K n=1 Tax=Striga asiatica TaxID=4170 RepID=A0A5A7Q3K4_STRAF|nr:NAD(P)H-quinone oxidoreductase subunit K [Striga asiatica]
MQNKILNLRDLTREPPEKTTVNEPLSREILLARSAVYSASATARSSSVSNTWTFPLLFGVTISAIDAFVLLFETFDFSRRELKSCLTAKIREMFAGGDRVKEGYERRRRLAEAARQVEMAIHKI